MNDYKIVGLDLSLTCSGYCVQTPHESWIGKVETKPNVFPTLRARVERIAKTLIKAIEYKMETPTVTILEEPIVVSASNSLQLGAVAAIVRQVIYNATGLDPIEVPGSSLKLYTAASGQAKKEDMKLAAFKKHKQDFQNKTNDECDAFCLAMLGLDLLQIRPKRRTAYEEKAIKKIAKNAAFTIDSAMSKLKSISN